MIDLDALQKRNVKNGPIQILHDFQFLPINVSGDFSYIKDMSFDEKLAHMYGRLKKLSDCGYGGVVLNVDFENYLQNDDSFKILDKVVDKAHELGLRVWLYDEQYYPSGSAGGLVLKNHPEYEGRGLACVCREMSAEGAPFRVASPLGHSELKYAFAVPFKDGKYDYGSKLDISQYKDAAGGLCWDAPDGKWKTYCYFVRVLYEMTYLAFSFRASRRYPNIADKKAMKRFLDITYEKYEKYLKKPLGKRIEAVFTDEPSIMFYLKYPEDRDPNDATQYKSISIYDRPDLDIPSYPYIPWADDIEKEFLDLYKYNITEFLPELFEQTRENDRYRMDFYGLIDKMVRDAYINQMHDYTASQGMKLGGHYLREEEFDRHPVMYGDILSHIGRMDIPGCDVLFSDINELRNSAACILASSAAHIYQKPHAMIEASNMLDENQQFSLSDMRLAMSSMFVHGIDVITSYYDENIFSDEERRKFTQYVSNLSALTAGGKNKVNTLLYYPFSQLCASKQPEGTVTQELDEYDTFNIQETVRRLLERQICFDFINDEKLLSCKIKKGKLVTEYGEEITNIVFPEIDFLGEKIAAVVTEAYKNGVNVIFAGNTRKIHGLNIQPIFMQENKNLPRANGFTTDTFCPDIRVRHTEFETYDLYMAVNTGKTVKFNAELPLGKGVCFIDPVAMKASKAETSLKENVLSVTLAMESGKCVFIYSEK